MKQPLGEWHIAKGGKVKARAQDGVVEVGNDDGWTAVLSRAEARDVMLTIAGAHADAAENETGDRRAR